MAKTKKRADGLIERCRVIDGKTRHFYGRTAKEVQAKLDAALIERLYQVPVEISHDQHGIPFLRTLRKTS